MIDSFVAELHPQLSIPIISFHTLVLVISIFTFQSLFNSFYFTNNKYSNNIL